VLVEGTVGLPHWLLVGVGLGLASSAAIAVFFVTAVRLFPTAPVERTDGGERRRRTEIRAYLDAIGEQYAENHPVEGQPVAFYLPQRDVAVTFDPRAYYRIDRSDTRAVLVEHELPGFQLGTRLPFDVPEVEFGPDESAVDPLEAALAELDVPTDAGLDEIRAAYRRRVKETHPDHGGDEDEFKRVREAYTTARKHAG
jgi:hypothetical protein